MKARLGVDRFPELADGVQRCICLAELSDQHLDVCSQEKASVIARHNTIRNTLHEACTRSGLTAVLEPRDNYRLPEKSGADFVVHGLKQDHQPVYADVTVTSPYTAYVLKHAGKPQLAAIKAEDRKNSVYKDAYTAAGAAFVPLAIETTGALGPSFINFLHHLKTRGAGKNEVYVNWSAPTFLAYFTQRIVLAVHEFTARQAVLIKERIVRGDLLPAIE